MPNLKFDGLIHAIKHVRSLPVILEETTDTYGNKAFRPKLNIGLKDAKDIVEGIMAIQPQDYVIQDLKNEISRLNGMLGNSERAYYELKESIRKLVDF